MANVRLQSAFQPFDFSTDSGLNVHRNELNSGRNLVLFVHGFHGTAYGTWPGLPKLVFDEESLDCDVGLFEYKTGLRRLGRVEPKLRDHIAELTAEVRELPHERVILVGHSMGGLLLLGTVKRLAETSASSDSRSVEPVAGLILFGTPRAGTPRVPRLLRLTREARLLRLHNDVAHDIDEFFATKVDTALDHRVSHKLLHVPMLVASATRDIWVDRFSSEFGLPAPQRRQFRGSHTSIVKSRDREGTVIKWLLKHLQELLTTSPFEAQVMRPRVLDQGDALVTRFSGHMSHPEWEEAYLTACRQVAVDHEIDLRDFRDCRTYPIALAIRAVKADEAESRRVEDQILGDVREQASDGSMTLAISIIGATAQYALPRLRELVGAPPAGLSRWVEDASGTEDLAAKMMRWIRLIHARRSATPAYYARRADLRDEAVLRAEGAEARSADNSPPNTGL